MSGRIRAGTGILSVKVGDGRVFEGSIPTKQSKPVQVWIEIRLSSLMGTCCIFSFIAVAAASVHAPVATLDSHFQLLAKPAKIVIYPLL